MARFFFSIVFVTCLSAISANAQISCTFSSSQYCQFMETCKNTRSEDTGIFYTQKSCDCQWLVYDPEFSEREMSTLIALVDEINKGNQSGAHTIVEKMGFDGAAFLLKVNRVDAYAKHCERL